MSTPDQFEQPPAYDEPQLGQTLPSEPAEDHLPDDREALLEEIEQTREELGATVEALAHKADIKAQVQQKVEEGKERLHEKQDEATGKLRQTLGGPAVPAAIAAVAAVALIVSMLRSRR